MTGRRLLLIGVVVAVIAGAILGTAAFVRAGQEDIFLEPANSVGPDPFTEISANFPTTTTDASGTTAGGTTTTALFGGSGNQKVCDPEALITFLTSNRAKGSAWIEALNADPTLKWSGGRALTIEDIPTYIRELTPTFLTEDTRVTNHGYKNGHPTARQSVL